MLTPPFLQNNSILPIHQSIKQKLDGFYLSQRIPHLLFHGSPGSGKRTLVYDFINKVYGYDKSKVKNHVMFVNCAHGKGIKFIREELKFFAKTNIQGNQGISFKSIVLFNADSLRIDAQSALRRCIELFSYNTRFFIVVENKHKLLNPILSRFCEIYVPEYIDVFSGQVQNLHQYHLTRVYGPVSDNMAWFNECFSKIGFGGNEQNIFLNHSTMVDIATEIYENGLSCLDLMKWYKIRDQTQECKTRNSEDTYVVNYIDAQLYYQEIKSEYRHEKILILVMLDFLFLRSNKH